MGGLKKNHAVLLISFLGCLVPAFNQQIHAGYRSVCTSVRSAIAAPPPFSCKFLSTIHVRDLAYFVLFPFVIHPHFHRKDFFYPYDEYREVGLPDPIHGGRFHLVTTAAASGTPQEVKLNGKVVSFAEGQDPDSWLVDWLHVYPTTLTQGQPVWISFHSR